MNVNLNKEDLEFLKNLQNELNTQEKDFHASPRFWVVAEHKKEFGIDSEYSDGQAIVDSDGNEWDDIDDFKDYLIDNYYFSLSEIEDIKSFDEILSLIENDEFTLEYYRENKNAIVPSTMFLTKKSCQKHIELNHYHYTQPHTYAMTAWRSPEVKRLLKVLREIDFEEVK